MYGRGRDNYHNVVCANTHLEGHWLRVRDWGGGGAFAEVVEEENQGEEEEEEEEVETIELGVCVCVFGHALGQTDTHILKCQ
jgi:hypothetical protein